ncbi:MAG: hypothetical protein ABIQ07_07290 [Ginsengibacter sp.]
MSNTQFSNIFLKGDEQQAEMIAEKYPWCSVAQLSLLLHAKKNNTTQFEEQAAKTALFFNNSNWLNWQLHLLSKPETENKQKEITASDNEFVEQKEFEEQEVVEENEEANTKIRQSLSQISSQANTAEESISFEQQHTVDYFLSQGIKIAEAPVTNDKLGNQVKSFTEWLKSMKKIHKEEFAEGDEQTDKTIQQIAEHSNAAAEVVTEAMADVLLKQSKTEKAIEVYEKLSLLNPSKSAYFAAKIDSLKTP